MQNFKFGGVMVLAVQLFNKIKKKKKKLCIFWIKFWYALDIDVSRNGNNLKLIVKSEFSLSMGLMLINHSNPYIHNTTVLCDIKLSRNTAIKIARYYVMATDLTG